ncbi:WD40/YVTN/BNR-like repeat-containing protein [Thauera linaloolentis]|uniref:Photosynthesis system II assembly factor Ycf48/Hcf136-like domain-containing protein n=1 Tax=Thauera linaloolentis (strain DSM 12138 / JCM 21573 / CCUG 41526 / CIP 105981 / IAM 15112 / NBRC 102519 / 47Lol) TaxID=1123367 RepID=N6Y0X2_THAL4|nr:YCF48-related protein [Thauera linaloolentis]ENO87796.1 hypothetical protein C666_10125 [Thauera linaloolentis 47Lol = DSM 12138]MCM8565281.1 YCF48-related protein [Thauera linaloolentis]
MRIDGSGITARAGMFAVAGVFAVFSLLAHSEAPKAGKGIDLLEMPALQSPKAAHSLLLGVTTAGSRLVAVGERGIVVLSDDQGQTWTQAQVPVSVTLNAVHFVSPDLGWAAGGDGVILRTDDGGRSWTKRLDGNQANELVLADLKARIGAVETAAARASDEEGGRFQAALETLGFRLEDAEAGAGFGPSRPLLALWFKDERLGFAVGAFGQIFRTDDGGEHWISLAGALENPDSLHLNAIVRLPDGTLAVVGERGMIWFSSDEGASWRANEVGYDGHLYGLIQAEPATLVAFGFAGNVFRSADGGQTWVKVARISEKSIVGAIHQEDLGVLLVARNGSLIRSRDAGKTFSISQQTVGASVASVLPWPFGAERKLVAVGHGGVSMISITDDRSDRK